MRKVATTTTPTAQFCRAMIYDPEDDSVGMYLFLFQSPNDSPCDADYWYEDMADAERHATESLEVVHCDWEYIPDPQPGHQDDRMAPGKQA